MATETQRGNETMGRVTVEFMVTNNQQVQAVNLGLLPSDRVHWFQLQGVVDTGSTHLVLPTDVADRLHFPKAGEDLVRYGDGRTATRATVEQVQVELLGRRGTFRAILEPERTTALIGAIVLEDLDLVVDCKNNRLVPRDPDHMIHEME
jgi:predicted aspartyl protease